MRRLLLFFALFATNYTAIMAQENVLEDKNPECNGTEYYNYGSSTKYSPAETHTKDGSGSFMFTGQGLRFLSNSVQPVSFDLKADRRYVLRAYIKMTDAPHGQKILVGVRKNDGSNNVERCWNTKAPNEWEEVVLLYKTVADGAYTFSIFPCYKYMYTTDGRHDRSDGSNLALCPTVYVDDFSVIELTDKNLSRKGQKSRKKSSVFENIRVDPKGNFLIREDGTWKAFNTFCWLQPDVAGGNNDLTFTDGTTTAKLSAVTFPFQQGTGRWSIIRGTGGRFADASDPHTVFTGKLHESYILRWTIPTECGDRSEDITVAFQKNGPGPQVTDIDGNKYHTVWTGNQLWMAENLRVTHEVTGEAIPLVEDDTAWDKLKDNDNDIGYCYYANNPDSAAQYGFLYTYAAAKDACPAGWHLPGGEEWTELEAYVSSKGHKGREGTVLKSTSGWYGNGNGTDDYGFSALPGGYRLYIHGTFGNGGGYAYFWSTARNENDAYGRRLGYCYSNILHYYISKSEGFSVRCIRDKVK